MSDQRHRQLNEQLRDALLAFYLTYVLPEDTTLQTPARKHTINNANDLYTYWLLDVQVSQAVPTSRVASAIASLQQYINAISVGLEPGYDKLGMTTKQQNTWRNNLHAYSVWRAIQQLRSFPANYLNPMLRRDKTESFQQLENDINQCRINSDNILPAIQRYLARFEEICSLKTLNGYIDGEKDRFAESTYYFVARSTVENTYYWRSLDMSRRYLHPATGGAPALKQDAPQPGAWSDWKKIPLPASENIPEHSVRPICFNNRLFVVWAQCISPAAASYSADYFWSEPDESEKNYKARLENYLKSRFIQFRLYFSYMKYDGSWSVPRVCSDEYCVMKELNKLDQNALMQATETVAVLDTSTSPASLFLGLNAHAPQKPVAGRDHTRSDFFQAVRLDQDFSSERLFSRGTVADLKPNAEHEKLAKRYLSLFIYNNSRNFNFHAPTSETVAITDIVSSTPTPAFTGWNFENKQAYISDQHYHSDIVFNTTSCALEVNARLEKAFPEHQSVTFRASTNWAELTLHLALLRPLPGSSGKLKLEHSSLLTLKTELIPPCSWVSVSMTSHKTGVTYSSLIYEFPDDALSVVKPQRLSAVRKDWSVSLEGRYIEYDAFNTLFENAHSDHRITLHFYATLNEQVNSQNDWLFDSVIATLYTRHYKPVIMTPRDENTPHPYNIHRNNSYIVGEPNTSRRALNGVFTSLTPAHLFSAHIQLNPETLRPEEEVSSIASTGTRPITILHGVLIYDTDTRHNSRSLRGYALKSLRLKLDPNNATPITPLAPRISRSPAQPEGTAEFIDFSGSLLKYSDVASPRTLRAPIHMNTTIGRHLSAAANVSLDRLFTIATNQSHEPALTSNATPHSLDFHGAHGKYFRELFLFLPWLVACRLNMEQRYAEAQSWLKYIFDPESRATEPQQHSRYWKVPALTQDKSEPGYQQDNPDDPHQIALSSPSCFRQALYMLYLDILLNRGDAAYRQASADSLAEAKLWYVRASSLLGPRPQISRADPWQPLTLQDLGASSQSTLYLPLNPDLVSRWDKLESRLYNLRHHLSISAKPLQQALFAPALAPHLLLSHYAHNASSDPLSATRQQTREIGHYRYQVVHAHAATLVENVIQLGNTLLVLFERKEQNEHLQLQQQHAWDLARIAVDQQRQGMRADEANREALLAGRQVLVSRQQYFEKLLNEGISPAEAQASQQYLESAQWETKASVAEAAAGLAMLAPNIFGTSNGGMRYEGAFYAIQAAARNMANEKRANAGHLDRTALFNRRVQEWSQALEQCRQELIQADLQLQAHEQQNTVLRLQLRHTETAMEQARFTYEVLSKHFSSAQLYQWLNSHLASFYYQAYDAAHSLCLSAQACWQFERADWNTRFIQSSHWHNQFKGLTAGESLKLDLQNMNTAYMQRNQRELEISKTLSLRLLHGKDRVPTLNKDWASLKHEMIVNGTVDFELSKALFDDDYPGHYLRRIKSVSVSLPATLGPYEDICATLTQTWNRTHLSAKDDDMLDNMRVREQVALSTGLNDSGLFTLNFDNDERYLPFEYTGAVSKWRLAFPNPAAQSSMLNSLSDIIVHVRYTARSAGGQG